MGLAIYFIWFYMVIIKLYANLDEKPDYNLVRVAKVISETRFIALPRSRLLQLK